VAAEPNAQLDGKSPLDLMANDERPVVVDFVEDMLTDLTHDLASLKAPLRTAPALAMKARLTRRVEASGSGPLRSRQLAFHIRQPAAVLSLSALRGMGEF